MLRKTNVLFPNEYDNGEVEFPVNEGKVAFLDVLRTLKDRLAKPDLPIGRIYIKVNGILWRPEAYLYENGKSITNEVGSYDEIYSLYSPPLFMPPYMSEQQIIESPYISEEEFTTAVLKFDYYATIDIVDSASNLMDRIMVSSRSVKRMALSTEDRKCGEFPYIWEIILELEATDYDRTRLVEWATWFFVECIVVNNKGEKQDIDMSKVNPNTIGCNCNKIADLLNMNPLDFKDFANDSLQHPVTEYYMFKRWGCDAVKRLQTLLMEIHSMPYSKTNRMNLEQFLLAYIGLCNRVEATSVRPPSWPYRNPTLINEDFFISSTFTQGCSCTGIQDFMEGYAIVEDVPYFNKGCVPYSITQSHDVLCSRLCQAFPMANNLCKDGVFLAGSLPSFLHLEDRMANHKFVAGEMCADLFIYGKSATMRYKSLEELVKRLEMYRRDYRIEYTVCKNIIEVCMWKVDTGCNGLVYHHTHEVSRSKPEVRMKIIYTNAKCKAEILYNFDSTYIQTGYENGKFSSTTEFHYFTARRESLINRSSIQLHRLLKIISRGFLPIVNQDFCYILGSRSDLPRLACTRNSIFTFRDMGYSTEAGMKKVSVTQKFSNKGESNTQITENIHYVEMPKKKKKTVNLLHLLKSVCYDDVLLNSYNSYSGKKICRLKVSKSTVYKNLANPSIPLINLPSKGAFLVTDFDVGKVMKKKEKLLRKQVKDTIQLKVAERIKSYESAIKNGKMFRTVEGYYRKPQNDEESQMSTYVVNIDDMDTFPTLEEIQFILRRENERLSPTIGIAHFDIRVRVGEKCKNGIKLDGTKVIYLSGKKRTLFTGSASIEKVVRKFLLQENQMEEFLKNGVSLDIPVKAFYVKTTLNDKYIGLDEKSNPEMNLDPDYTHTAVVCYCSDAEPLYFNIMRVTKHLLKGVAESEDAFDSDTDDGSDECKSEDSESEEEHHKIPSFHVETKRTTTKSCMSDKITNAVVKKCRRVPSTPPPVTESVLTMKKTIRREVSSEEKDKVLTKVDKRTSSKKNAKMSPLKMFSTGTKNMVKTLGPVKEGVLNALNSVKTGVLGTLVLAKEQVVGEDGLVKTKGLSTFPNRDASTLGDLLSLKTEPAKSNTSLPSKTVKDSESSTAIMTASNQQPSRTLVRSSESSSEVSSKTVRNSESSEEVPISTKSREEDSESSEVAISNRSRAVDQNMATKTIRDSESSEEVPTTSTRYIEASSEKTMPSRRVVTNTLPSRSRRDIPIEELRNKTKDTGLPSQNRVATTSAGLISSEPLPQEGTRSNTRIKSTQPEESSEIEPPMVIRSLSRKSKTQDQSEEEDIDPDDLFHTNV